MAVIAQPNQTDISSAPISSIKRSASLAISSIEQSQQAASQFTNTLSSRLSEFSNIMMKRGNAKMEADAKNKAVADVMSGKKTEVDLTTLYGQAYSSAATATYNGKVKLDAYRVTGEIRRKANGDVNTFNKLVGDYENALLQTAPNDESKMIAQRYIEAYRVSHSNSMIDENDKKDKMYQASVYNANIVNATRELINLYDNNNDKLINERIGEIKLHGETLRDEGVISEATRAKTFQYLKQNVQRETQRSNFNSILSTSVDAAALRIAEFQQEIPEGMDVATHRTIASDMITAYNHKIKKDKAELTSTIKQNDAIVDDAISILKTGKVPNNYQDILDLPMSEKKQMELGTAVQMQFEVQELNRLTIDEQAQYIQDMKSNQQPDAYDFERVSYLEKLYNYNSKKANTDPITLSVEQGLESISPVTSKNMDALADRTILFDKIEDYYGRPGKIFTSDEATKLAADYNNGTFIDKKSILSSLTASLDGKYLKSAINELKNKKNENIKYSAMMFIGGREDIADIAMQGENTDVPLPEAFKTDYANYIKNVFGSTEGDGYNIFLKGAGNYYKGKSKIDGEAPDITDVFEESIGMVYEMNGKNVLLPHGTTESEFDDWMDNIQIEGDPELSKRLNDMTDTFFSGDTQLQSVGNGKYHIILNSSTMPLIATDKDGNIIELDWNNKR